MLHKQPASTLLDLVGQTPLLQVSASLFFKLEYQNPFRCVADRIVRNLIRSGCIDGPLRIDVVDPLSVSAIGLTRVQGYRHSQSAVLDGDPAFRGAGAEALRQLLDPYTTSGGHDALVDRIAKHRESALMETWAEIGAEVRTDLPAPVDPPTYVIPDLPWIGLGAAEDQLRFARESLGKTVALVTILEEDRGGQTEGIIGVSRAAAVAAARRLGRETGATPYLLGGAVAQCCFEKAGRGITIGILADSAEWHDFALDEDAQTPER